MAAESWPAEPLMAGRRATRNSVTMHTMCVTLGASCDPASGRKAV